MKSAADISVIFDIALHGIIDGFVEMEATPRRLFFSGEMLYAFVIKNYCFMYALGPLRVNRYLCVGLLILLFN